jgi:non-specific serine/threonine protein kinase
VGGDRTALPRQRTLAATLDWSFDLLSSVEQATLLRLSVFTGGWTLEAAEAVAGGGPIGADDILDLLTSLIDKSLVLVEPEGQTGEEPRYRLLETVREYAAQQLMQRGESAAIRGQHATYYMGLAENAELHVSFMRPGRGEAVWLSRLEMDHNNLRTALSWYMECGQPERGLRLAVALFGFWQARGYHSESRRWLELLLAAAPEAPPSLRAAALHWAGMAAHWQGDLTRGRSLYEASLALARQIADPSSVASALAGLGVLAWEEGDERASSEFLDEGIAVARECGDIARLSGLLRDKSHAPRVQGRYAEAQAYLEESVALARAVQHHNFVARGLSLLGRVAYLQGNYDKAGARFRESLSMRHHRGRFTSDCFEGIAAVLGAHGHAERAARLFGAAEAVRRQTGVVRYAGERAAYDQDVVVVRRELGEAACAAAWAEGRKMSFDEAIAYALEDATR